MSDESVAADNASLGFCLATWKITVTGAECGTLTCTAICLSVSICGTHLEDTFGILRFYCNRLILTIEFPTVLKNKHLPALKKRPQRCARVLFQKFFRDKHFEMIALLNRLLFFSEPEETSRCSTFSCGARAPTIFKSAEQNPRQTFSAATDIWRTRSLCSG